MIQLTPNKAIVNLVMYYDGRKTETIKLDARNVETVAKVYEQAGYERVSNIVYVKRQLF